MACRRPCGRGREDENPVYPPEHAGPVQAPGPYLASNPKNQVAFITKRKDVDLPGVRKLLYAPTRASRVSTHHYVRLFENAVLHGQQVVRICQELRREGFTPDLVIAHPGWGESLFVKDIFPASPLVNYCEYYYQGRGGDIGFDPSDPPELDVLCRLRARDAHLLLALEACDVGWSPTSWQKSRHPAMLQKKIGVVFDGIDTSVVKPNPGARFELPSGQILTSADETITYVARNLEPYRGFPTFVRALPDILRRRPLAHVVCVGGDEVSYGSQPEGGKTWRETMLAEVDVDLSRVHFINHLPYDRYLTLLQVSKVHIYLTVPFVLSWSFMEAMAAGCVVVGSRTPPVEEVLVDGENGLFTDFFSPSDVAADVDAALEDPRREAIRRAARQTVIDRYDLKVCLPAQLALLRQAAQGRRATPAPITR